MLGRSSPRGLVGRMARITGDAPRLRSAVSAAAAARGLGSTLPGEAPKAEPEEEVETQEEPLDC